MIKTINELVQKAKDIETKKIVVACAADQHVLEAVELARVENIVDPILVGDMNKIHSLMLELSISPNDYEIIDETDKEKACLLAVKLVSSNDGHFLMKGLVDTSIILKAALNKEFGLRTQNRISHVSVMEVPTHHKLIFMSDGAMNIAPTLDEKRQIIENSVKIAHALGIETPNVGVLGAVEKVNPKMEATVDADALVSMNQEGIIKQCKVGGPFDLDNAINKEAAILKKFNSPCLYLYI